MGVLMIICIIFIHKMDINVLNITQDYCVLLLLFWLWQSFEKSPLPYMTMSSHPWKADNWSTCWAIPSGMIKTWVNLCYPDWCNENILHYVVIPFRFKSKLCHFHVIWPTWQCLAFLSLNFLNLLNRGNSTYLTVL
jgi:hypothetical protein